MSIRMGINVKGSAVGAWSCLSVLCMALLRMLHVARKREH